MLGLSVRIQPVRYYWDTGTWFTGDSNFGPYWLLSWWYTLYLITCCYWRYSVWVFMIYLLVTEHLYLIVWNYWQVWLTLFCLLRYSFLTCAWLVKKIWCWRPHTLFEIFSEALRISGQLSSSNLFGKFASKIISKCPFFCLHTFHYKFTETMVSYFRSSSFCLFENWVW